MENILRNAPKAEIKRIFRAAMEQEIKNGTAPAHPVAMPSLYGRRGEYIPAHEVLCEEQTVLRSH